MLQPRETTIFLICALILANCEGLDDINSSQRLRRQNSNDVTTVLLVDSHGRSSFGRYLSVKPDLGLITSTARTFIQEGVTTEYATQVLGTTLDNGRLYAHLLTKSSRVLYDGDTPSKSYDSQKKWNFDDNLFATKTFLRNTDFISPNQVEPVLVFPTTTPYNNPQTLSEEEILEEEPSNNVRVPYEVPQQNNVKIFKINPQMHDLSTDNFINHKEGLKPAIQGLNLSKISKVRQWDNLPTFTVRNEFSPSGFSYLGDFPDFSTNTEKTKATTVAERKAKLLFRAGLAKPEVKDRKTTTYSGFADFTTTVGDTVIVFTPHTTEPPRKVGQVTYISVEPTLRPSSTVKFPTVNTAIKTFLFHEPPMETKTVEGHKLHMKTSLPTMVIDKTDRLRKPKDNQASEVYEDLEAKSAVLAHEQQMEKASPSIPQKKAFSTSSGSTIIYNPDIIEPSERQTPMLSTPSDEDIAKIFAALQAQAKQQTQPLNTPSTIFLEETSTFEKPSATEISSGATTIFFEDELPIENTAVIEEPTTTTRIIKEDKTTTTTEDSITTEKLTTTTEKLTTQKDPTTTNSIDTTSEEVLSTLPLEETTPEITSNEIDRDLDDRESVPQCKNGLEIVPTTVYKTLTYLTTFFIPQDDDDDETSTSIKSNEVVSSEIGFETKSCSGISPSSSMRTIQPTIATTTEEEKITTTDKLSETTTDEITTELLTTPALESTPEEITTERRHVTESDPETTELTTESGEEIELIFKTLYTTYTYLTTYFQDTTSSIASKIVVTTNVITSTLIPGSEASDSAVAGLFERDDNLVNNYKSRTVSFDDLAEISPTKLDHNILPTLTYEEDEIQTTTPFLNDLKVQQNGVKTYYTTYTYFTTIFVDGETEISSRTEVYTNYVTSSIQATASNSDIVPTRLLSLFDEKENSSDKTSSSIVPSLNVTPLNSYNTTIHREKSLENVDIYASKLDNNILSTSVPKEPSYVTLQRGGTTTEDTNVNNNALNLNDFETISTMVTDVRSSTSEGGRRIIDNVDKRNALLDDQIVSESNNDSEIIPSPTLLLQTSYTTFTYFTTMYQGTTSSNVVSRLETITNVVTETLTPTHTLSVEDLSLPITYFTTFTYWTTLYKDGVTKTSSREETVSNVVTPTPSLSSSLPIIITSTVESTSSEITPTQAESIQPSTVGDDDLTTYFTTYTYYTTSYVGESTVINSRLETVTNVINSTAETDSNQIGRAVGTASVNLIETTKQKENTKPTGLLSTIVNTLENLGTTTILSTDVFGTYIDGLYAKVLESTSSIITPTISPSAVESNLKPTGVVSINKGKIIDAEGISTLYYTTQAVGTYIDNLYAQVIESTSSLNVNEERKAALATDALPVHRTGLVRLIEGSIVQNKTTTLYQSKVLGTLIDGRYAQIIESTSSFLFSKPTTPSSVLDIAPSATQAPEQSISPTSTPISPSPVVIESSLSDSSRIDEDVTTEEPDEENEDESSRTKSRLTFQTRKRTFTPVIRPFASRGRPTFAPKRKGGGQSATTVTRSDVTPTVTAVPASKGRFGNRKASSTTNNIVPSATGSRRFARPKASNTGVANARKSSSRIQPTASGFGASSRRGGLRSSVGGGSRANSQLYAGNSKFRIRPTLASTLNRNFATGTPSGIEEENDLTTVITNNPTDSIDDGLETTLFLATTTEGSSRRSQNPLLRFKRPPIARATTPRPQKTKSKNKVTTTTPKPKTTLSRSNKISRPRNNALFPRRNLFTTTTPPPEEEEEEYLEEGENDDEDTDYDSSQTNPQTEPAPKSETRKSRSSSIQIKPFSGFKKRTRREVNYSRFRRPGSRTTASPNKSLEPETEAVAKTTKPKSSSNRYSSRNSNRKTTAATTSSPSTRKRISPSKSSTQGRSQFTLREKDASRSSFKRPSTTNSRPKTTVSSRPKSPRLRTTAQPENKKSSSRATQSRRRTTSSRQKISQEHIDENFLIPKFDGTITVTHSIPTEVTIPVVNGKITEYKNIITAKYSTEILAPKQYSTSVNPFGKDVTVLLGESTSIADNGATHVTQYVLNETPTSSVIFTPTYIRGRKTSFSHVIPSTAYGVEEVVNTIQPALAAQAPLANILLSQLLLGQNPLYPLQNPAVQGTPTTEFKTRATTYVTTVTSVTSTVIPLTFRGKEILTTIIDSSVSVVTATEFLTDTIIATPSLSFPGSAPQLNTLLLPLLQQQLAAQQPLQPQQPAGVFNLHQPQAQALINTKAKSYLTSEEDNEEVEQAISEEIREVPSRKRSRNKNKKAPTPAPTEPPKETSVITLYVSGRIPGEFSTVLSTVVVGENERRRREVRASQTSDDLVVSTLDYHDAYLNPGDKDVFGVTETVATESLESIIGDVSRHFNTHVSSMPKPTKTTNQASKKYKIKLVDLDEKAPLTDKVETSQVFEGKYYNHEQNLNVSKHIYRSKRATELINNPKTRVVKKLIRKELVSQKEMTTRKPRRRLLIKKKKKKRLLPKSRRTVVVTRKKLLPKTSSIVLDEGMVGTSLASIVSTETRSSELFTSSIVVDEGLVETSLATIVSSETRSSELFTVEYTSEENKISDTSEETFQNIPDYEPVFPELVDDLSAPPLLLFKTTVLSSIELATRTIVSSRLRTYTFIVTRVNGAEHIVTSTTEIKPQTKTTILTEPLTKFTTLTLLDLDVTSTLNPIPMTPFIPQLKNTDQGKAIEEARYNLATRVMSNGVEVIVAGDKSTFPGNPNFKRILPSTVYKPVTLKPSTLSDHMMMILPLESPQINNLAPNQFVTKTCLTTFTYLTTYLESGTTTVSSHEQVVSNIATEERNSGKILPTPAMGITLTQYPNLSVGVFHTTYTYLNTILDGEQPLVVSSKHTVTNTVTAPDDLLSLLQNSENLSAIKDTNTYYSTVSLSKTLYEGDKSQVISTNEVVTQVVITESVPPKATSVMTSYIALDVEPNTISADFVTTDVTKTYFVTYTYYNTVTKNGKPTIHTNISTSSDIVTEKLYLHPKHSSKNEEKQKQKIEQNLENIRILATKTYQTTFTYFTTLLQEEVPNSPTVISSHSKIVEKVVTETINPDMLDRKYLSLWKKELKENSDGITKLATLNNGQKLEITIIPEEINPTHVLPIEKTQMPDSPKTESTPIESSTPNVITGSTIIFFDDLPTTETPSLSSKIIRKTASSTISTKVRRSSKSRTSSVSKTSEIKPATKYPKPNNQVSDLLGLGSININSLQALKPVLNAMAGLIQTNLKSNRRNDSIATTNKPHEDDPNTQNRSPIYIPVGEVGDDIETAESQNIATFHRQETADWDQRQKTHESLLLNRGIPISPGDVITTNSDVIVGKPGRIGPRIPSIPLNQISEEASYQLKPPPVLNPAKKWPKRNHDYNPTPRPVIHAPNKDDYVGPPPPFEKQKHIPLDQAYGSSDLTHQKVIIQDKMVKFDNPMKDYQPSIVLPEIIERSTGQPLLVNIQPSQVAFVNIPHNRTTAFIYGGSTEPHRSGQYFDDPSPYPEPEFSGIDNFNNGVPQFASIYDGGSVPTQKEVVGVIKVSPQAIDKHQIQVNINPSRPNPLNKQDYLHNPPISFGMVQQHDEFNGHVISHRPNVQMFNEVEGVGSVGGPSPAYKLQTDQESKHQIKSQSSNGAYPSIISGNRFGNGFKDKPPPQLEVFDTKPKLINSFSSKPNQDFANILPPSLNQSNKQNQGPYTTFQHEQNNGSRYKLNKFPPKRISFGQRPEDLRYNSNIVDLKPPNAKSKLPSRYRPRPKPSNLEYMTPPPFNTNKYSTYPTFNELQKHIPLTSERQEADLHLSDSSYFEDDNDYLTNEEGGVGQESNNRPLRPGEIPAEILKIKSKVKPITTVLKPPIVNMPRPFGEIIVSPDNQQTNQINHYEPDRLNYITPKPDNTFITYIGSFTNKPIDKQNHFQSTTSAKPTTARSIRKPEVFHQNISHRPKPPSSTTKISNRPRVTSLPLDPPTSKPQIIRPVIRGKPLSITDLLNRERVTTTPSTTTVRSVVTEREQSVYDMEVMKPPPAVPDFIIKPPSIDSHTTAKTTTLEVSRLSNQVLGMKPPPLDTETSIGTTKVSSRRPFTRPTVKITTRRPNYKTYVKNKTSKPPHQLTTSSFPEIMSSEIESKESTTGSLPALSETPALHNVVTTSPYVQSSTNIAATTVRHPENNKNNTKSKIVIPTRYITHTKTSTVTITKTTVVKTLGGPPSTLTLLVTKTEKSTLIDTVTEFHTLLKPTNIIETITTTISTSAIPTFSTIAPSTSETIIPTIIVENDEDLDEFIIIETDPPPVESVQEEPSDNDSIFVVMTDKNKGSVVKVPNGTYEVHERDEVLSTNEVSNVLLGGIFIASPPSLEVPSSRDKCEPECKASRNELCQKAEGIMRCVCRPGFARMFPDRPCIPTYTYELHVDLERLGKDKLRFNQTLGNENSTEFNKLTSQVHEAVDRMVMQSDLRDIYHGVHVNSYGPSGPFGINTKFYLQLSDNTDERRLEDIFKKYLRGNNYSLGGTEIYASKEGLDSLRAQDFDECKHAKFHDCSENAQCFNLKGTYTCSCKEGFADLSENILYPGRLCSAEIIGCERCNYHGTCYSLGENQHLCECFQWYAGENCHINLKVLLIALVTLGSILLILLLICVIITCCRKKPNKTKMTTGMSFLPQRVPIDRRAMIQDTSSEDSRSETNPPYVPKRKKIKGALKKTSDLDVGEMSYSEQKDRSLTVMIPRAKYHPTPPSTSLINYTSFEAQKTAPATSTESKLLSYLDAGPSPIRPDSKRKYSDSYSEDKFVSRKTSGALVSAGFEVSATVLGNNMGTLGTCGTEADRSENATLIHKISADLLSSTGTRSQFNTLRDHDIDKMSTWLDITPRINATISEARSYDETTIPPAMKTFRRDYDSKPSSQHQNDEANTMAERDLGSTFLLPHTHLYKPDRGSDISGFESL